MMGAGNRTKVRRRRSPVFSAWLAIRSRGPMRERWRSKCVRGYTFPSTSGRIAGVGYHHHRPAFGCYR